ncbi:MAG: O-antigen ligase family protein [Flavobacteriales bacterium]|nr:O-antigen ligase family protein [Flavobacteriales bacterium]
MNRISDLKNFFFILLGASIPTSVAFTNILIGLFTFIWIIEGDFVEKFKIIKSTKWIYSLLALVILYLFGLLYGEYHSDYHYAIKRVLLLLFFIPIITSNFSSITIRYSVHGFLFANLIAALIAISINHNLISPLFQNSAISAFILYNYHNILLSFSSLLSFIFFTKSKSKYSFLYLISIVIFSISIFTEAGRAGQLTFNLFFFLFALYFFSKRKAYSIIILSYLIALNIISYEKSDIYKHRVKHLTHIVQNDGELKNPKKQKIDDRYLFVKTSMELIPKKIFFGYGTGSFSSNFLNNNDHVLDYPNFEHKTPHNNYLYILFELGFIGLIFFLSIFYFQIKELLNKDLINTEKILLPLFMLFLMLFDSYMFIFSITLFYIFMYKIFTQLDFKQ